jgi:hypothetical protein
MPDETDTKRNNSDILELIMRDVLAEMRGFTRGTCRNGPTGGLEIISIERNRETSPPAASIIPFPQRNSEK